MTERTRLTAAFVREAFDYIDGRLYWKARPLHHFADEWRQKIFNSRQAGCLVGTSVHGYGMVNLSIGRVGVHRIVFLLHHGYLPKEIDHIDGNPRNNRIENLRAATHAQNLRNMKTPAHNTSGVKGVSWSKSTGKWAVSIRVSGKLKHLGVFTSKEDASAARKEAEAMHYGDFANGR